MRDRRHRRVSRARGRRPAQAGRLRHEDPEEVRRPRASPTSSTRRSCSCSAARSTATSRRCSPPTSRSACRSRSSCSARDALKKKYLPRCAAGEISAFALTEPQVGSDPARLHDHRRADRRRGDYILNGEKLWCTNGTLAKLLVVMARDPKTQEDQRLRRRDRLAGRQGRAPLPLHGPARRSPTRVISFTNVRVPAREPDRRGGQGPQDRAHHPQRRPPVDPQRLGGHRQALPARSAARWAAERVQWGKPVGKHEAIAHKIADMAATTFAMESIVDAGDRDGRPRRLRHPPRGGGLQGVEHAPAPGRSSTTRCRSAAAAATRPSTRSTARGEEPIGVERMMRDYRINKIFEGSTRDHAPLHGARGGGQAPRRSPAR